MHFLLYQRIRVMTRYSWTELHIINFYHFFLLFVFFFFFFAFFGSFFALFCFSDFGATWNLSSLLKLTHDHPLRGTKSLFLTVQSSIYTYSVTPTGRLATFKIQVFIHVKMKDRLYYFE